MKTIHHLLLAALILAGTLLAFGFAPREVLSTDPVYGDAQPLGDGFARAYAVLNEDGQATALGIELDEAALAGLPSEGHYFVETTLALPAGIDLAPFDHISVDWVPHGHDPPGIYDIPHFDFHFYMMRAEDRDQIIPTNPEFVALGERLPDAAYIPAGYILPPGLPPVPRMGSHLVNPESPELNGERFTKTFLFGSYDGQILFLEPMVTREYLKSLKKNGSPAVSTPLAHSQAVQMPGFYPASYSVAYHPDRKVYTIALEGLEYRDR